jgi:predicted amidohydrolase
MKDLKAATVQFHHAAGDKTYNLGVVEDFVQQAAEQRVELLVFPEMCITGYWHVRHLCRAAILDLAEPVPDGPTTQRVLELAARHRMTLGVGLIERADDGQLYNAYVVAMPDGRFVCHRKLHCFISEHMASGDRYTVFDTPHGCRVGVLICYDNNLIENARITALQGAEVLLAPHQTGGCDASSPGGMGLIDLKLWEQREAEPDAIEAEFRGHKGRGWLMRWLPSRAHDNGMFLLFSNGVGIDDDEVRTGNAMILDPYGRVLAETCVARDHMVVAELQAELREKSTGQRWVRGRRPELYAPLVHVTGDELDPRAARFGANPPVDHA